MTTAHESAFPLVAQPFTIGAVRLKNRLFQSAHTTNFGASDKSGPSARHISYHQERARGGIALIITEGIRIYQPTWRKGRMGAFSDTAVPDFERLVRAVTAEDCAIFAQLNDPGRHLRLDRMAPVSASALPWTHGGAIPHALSVPEIDEVVAAFADGAVRMARAGFQGIELQCGHGHLINQFLSPATNHRTDGYGGSPAARMRFMLEVVERVTDATDVVVGIRISADEFQPGGLRVPDTLDVVRNVLSRTRVDFLHVSHSFYTGNEALATQVADMAWPSAPFRHLPRAFKREFPQVPVMAICRMDDALVAESLLTDGDADLVGMARPQIADPALVAKSLGGRHDEVRHCIACNQGCIGRSETGSPISCVVNPRVGLEAEFDAVPLVGIAERNRVTVVGGGPAGMEAALTAVRRGHAVELFERGAVLGGQVRRLSSMSGRERFGLLVEEQERELLRHGVTIHRAVDVDAERLAAAPGPIVLATGSRPDPEPIPGASRTWSTWEAIDQPALLGGRVVIVDDEGGWPAATLAEHLARGGAAVTIVTSEASFAPNVTVYSRVALVRRLRDLGVAILPLRSPSEMVDSTLGLIDTISGAQTQIRGVSAIVRAGPPVAVDGLFDDLVKAGFAGLVHVVGDAYAPRTALEAVYEGHLAGVSIGCDEHPALHALPTYRRPQRVGRPVNT
jgi:dimethylglycine catabolism A